MTRCNWNLHTSGDRLKPRKRSRLRIQFGKTFYTFRRWLHWQLHARSYAGSVEPEPLPCKITGHATPFQRKLKDVQPWMLENKVVNLTLASRKISGLVINPGEVFSFWRSVGRPSRSKGYRDGMVLFYGQIQTGIGGGLCQLSNLLFWMFLHSPLTVTQRYRHSFDVSPDDNRTQPFGTGATCVYNYIDLQCINSTPHPVQIMLTMTDTHLEGSLHSNIAQTCKYSVYEKEHCIRRQSWGGYTRHNLIYRKQFRNGQCTADEYLFRNDAIMMYQPFLDHQGGSPRSATEMQTVNA